MYTLELNYQFGTKFIEMNRIPDLKELKTRYKPDKEYGVLAWAMLRGSKNEVIERYYL